jgi:hypothetical protein
MCRGRFRGGPGCGHTNWTYYHTDASLTADADGEFRRLQNDRTVLLLTGMSALGLAVVKLAWELDERRVELSEA